MANTFHDLRTGGAGASNPSSGGKPSLDFRGPQEKGKPAFTTAHRQAVGSGTAGQPAKVPNRSGPDKDNVPKHAAGTTGHIRPAGTMGGIRSKMSPPPRRNAK